MKKPKTVFGDSVNVFKVSFKFSDMAKAYEYFKQFVNLSHVVVNTVLILPDQPVATFRIVTIGGIKYFKHKLPMDCEEFDVELLSIKDISKTWPVSSGELSALNYLFAQDYIQGVLTDFFEPASN